MAIIPSPTAARNMISGLAARWVWGHRDKTTRTFVATITFTIRMIVLNPSSRGNC